VAGNSSSYVDDHYFEEKMKENSGNQEFQTFAVKVKTIRADWIINEDIGKQFLIEMLHKKNAELFVTPYI
jgi:hypothetical protein